LALVLDEEPLQGIKPQSRDLLASVMHFRLQMEIKTRGTIR
jgi:hypothetical protein